MNKIYYLGGPYSHPDKQIEKNRYRDITLISAKLVLRGYTIFSPLTMTHPIHRAALKELNVEISQEDWVKYDVAFMDISDAIIAYKAPGWENSKGLKFEIEHFHSQNKPVYYITAEEADTWLP